MKKVLIIAFAMILVLSLAACGGSGTPSNSTPTPPASSGGDSITTPPSSTPDSAPGKNTGDSDISTPEGRLAKAGLSLEDIRPEHFEDMEIDPDAGDEGVYLFLEKGTIVLDITNPETSMRPDFYNRLYDAIAAASDDGKVYEMYFGFGDMTETPRPSDDPDGNMNAMIFFASWSYKKDGRVVTVLASDTSAEKQADGETYPVFFLDLSYE